MEHAFAVLGKRLSVAVHPRAANRRHP
jgi:hypothetical protein